MRQFLRYGIALIIAVLVTGGVAMVYHSVPLLLGIFVIYAVGIAIVLRYPALLWNHGSVDRLASAVFAGGVTFGPLSLAQGLGSEFHFGAGILGLGLTLFGVATGVWMVDTPNQGN